MKKLGELVIRCSFQQVGFHCWPEAPEELAYLRDMHRHVFHVQVQVIVTHDNRQIEFITLKKIASNVFRSMSECEEYGLNYGPRSCEMLAEELGLALAEKGYNVDAVSVDEDDENGATAFFCEE